MKAKYNKEKDTITLGEGVDLLESLYDNIRKPVFIDIINKMSTKIGTYKKQSIVVTEDLIQQKSYQIYLETGKTNEKDNWF